jgi:hypothetical protein
MLNISATPPHPRVTTIECPPVVFGCQPVEAPAHHAGGVVRGYGACSVSGCGCQGFMGSDQLCGNCHHNYSFHS